jgi:hypothetical protein
VSLGNCSRQENKWKSVSPWSLVSGVAPQLGQFKWVLAACAALAMKARSVFAGLADEFVYGNTEARSDIHFPRPLDLNCIVQCIRLSYRDLV